MENRPHLSADGLVDLSEKLVLLRIRGGDNIRFDGLANKGFYTDELARGNGRLFRACAFSEQPFNCFSIRLLLLRAALSLFGLSLIALLIFRNP